MELGRDEKYLRNTDLSGCSVELQGENIKVKPEEKEHSPIFLPGSTRCAQAIGGVSGVALARRPTPDRWTPTKMRDQQRRAGRRGAAGNVWCRTRSECLTSMSNGT